MITAFERNTARQHIQVELHKIAPNSISTRTLARNTISHIHNLCPASTINIFHIFGIMSGFVRRKDAQIFPRKLGKSGIRIPPATPSAFHPHSLMHQAPIPVSESGKSALRG